MQEKLEKDVISLIFREYPNLRDQINKARVVKRNFTGVCFLLYRKDRPRRSLELKVARAEAGTKTR